MHMQTRLCITASWRFRLWFLCIRFDSKREHAVVGDMLGKHLPFESSPSDFFVKQSMKRYVMRHETLKNTHHNNSYLWLLVLVFQRSFWLWIQGSIKQCVSGVCKENFSLFTHLEYHDDVEPFRSPKISIHCVKTVLSSPWNTTVYYISLNPNLLSPSRVYSMQKKVRNDNTRQLWKATIIPFSSHHTAWWSALRTKLVKMWTGSKW